MKGAPRPLRLVICLGWLIFTIGLLSFAFLYLRYGGSSVPKARWRSRWGQPHTVVFRDPLGRFLIDHPSNWDESAPFERFTQHSIGDLTSTDTVAIRHAQPTGLLVVIRYVAPKPISSDQWFKLASTDGPLKDVFGAKILNRERIEFAGSRALKVVTEDMVKGEVYRFESWFVPHGAEALRITIAAPVKSFRLVEPELRQMVTSFRFVAGNPDRK